MGQFVSKVKRRCSGESLEDQAHLLGIPLELRIRILVTLRPQDKLVLRQVCVQLASEIDNFVGPSNCLLNNNIRRKTIMFYTKCYVQNIEVNMPFTTNNFKNVISNPSALKSFIINRRGALGPEFVTNVLQHCENLRNLELGGTIKGLLVPYGPNICLQRLTHFKLNSNNMHFVHLLDTRVEAFVNALNGRPFDLYSALTYWHNQLTILRRLLCPNLEEARLFLYSCENAEMNYADEIELAGLFLRFLGRHPYLNKLILSHDHRPVLHRLQEFQRPLTFFSKHFRTLQNFIRETQSHQLLSPVETLIPLKLNFENLKKFEFCSKISTNYGSTDSENFESHILNFLKTLKTLESIKFSASKCSPLPWAEIETLLHNNAETLEHLEIFGKIIGVISFQVLSKCSSLRVMRLNNKQKYRHASLSPVIENFGIHNAMIDNLETLILQNVGLKSSDFKSLYRLRKLKHLGLYRWRCGLGEENMSLEGIQTVLAIPTLEALLIPWPRNFMKDLDSIVMELDQRCRRNYFKLKTYLHPPDARRLGVIQYLCIDQYYTDHYWSKTDWGFRILHTFEQI